MPAKADDLQGYRAEAWLAGLKLAQGTSHHQVAPLVATAFADTVLAAFDKQFLATADKPAKAA